MATSIWGATGVTPAATDRIPVDVSSSGAASRWTGQQIADAAGFIGRTHNALGSISTATAINLANGTYVSATIAGPLEFTITNAPASPNGCEFTFVLTDGGSATITWPGSVTWASGTAPTLTASGVDVLHFATGNGGTNWYASHDRDEVYQAILVSGTNIKTINSTSLLGSGDIAISASPGGSSGQGQYNSAGSLAGMPLWVVDANKLAQRNGTAAQEFQVDRTWTDLSNYETLSFGWDGDVAVIAPKAAGTGTVRALRLHAKNATNQGYIEVVRADYGVRVNSYYGTGDPCALTLGNSLVVASAKATNISNSTASFGWDGLWFQGLAGDVEIGFRENWGYDQAVAALRMSGCNQYPGNTTNLNGGNLYYKGGDGASSSAGAANGGHIYWDGGRGYGTGVDGNVIVGNTRGKLQLKAYAVASLGPATPAGMRAFASDANATTFYSVVAGGGANFVPVFSDGTDWRIG